MLLANGTRSPQHSHHQKRSMSANMINTADLNRVDSISISPKSSKRDVDKEKQLAKSELIVEDEQIATDGTLPSGKRNSPHHMLGIER